MNTIPRFTIYLAGLAALAMPAHATVTTFAEYHLGETGSLEPTTNKPQDSTGNLRHFSNDISGAAATVGTAGVSAPGSTEYLDVSGAGDEGWYGADFSTLPTDNFAFGIYARAASIGAGAGGVFTTAGGNGGFKISLETNGWGASAHNIAWIGSAGGEVGSFTADTWVHLAMIRSGGTTEFYIDSVGQGAAYTGAPVMGDGHLTVSPGGSDYFDGQVDEARVVTFTAGETTANILAALQGSPPPAPSSFVNVGPAATWATVGLSTDEASSFRLGGGSDDFATVSDPDGLSVVMGAAPKHVINIDPQAPLSAGTYPLISYSGTIGGLGFAGLELATIPSAGRPYIANLADSGTTIDLVVTSGPENLTWTAAIDTIWDNSTANWKFTTGGASATFFADDSVLFDDTAPTGAVTLSGTIAPGSVEINNSSLAYTFDGDPITGSTALNKLGTGTVTFNNPNDFTGAANIADGTVILSPTGALGTGPITNDGTLVSQHVTPVTLPNAIDGSGTLQKTGAGTLLVTGNNNGFTGDIDHQAGIIQSGNANCLGDAVGITTVSSGATLDVNGIGFGAEPIEIIGTGVGGNGVIVNSGANELDGVVALTLTGDATVGGTNRWDVRGATSVVDGDFTLTKVGANQISVVDADVTVRNIIVTDGLFAIEFGAVIDETYPGTITVTGGALGFGDYGVATSCTKPIVLNGGELMTTSDGANGNSMIASAITLSAPTNEFDIQSGSTVFLDGSVSGIGSLVKTGDGVLDLFLAPAYTGDTTVDAGTLALTVSGLDDASSVSIGAAATLELNFAGNDTVDTLTIDGVGQPAGSYDSTHPSGAFTGTGTLVVTTGSGTAYDAWAALFPGLTNTDPALDFENDGLDTGVEYVVGGDPTLNDAASVAPTGDYTGAGLEFTFRRTDLANNDPNTTITVEYGSDLIGWTPAQDGVDGVSITVNDEFYGPGIDQVIVGLPTGLASPNEMLFARLNVSMP